MSAVIDKLQRSGDIPDLNSFVYSTASVPSIRQALFPLDAQVEIKVLSKIQVISFCEHVFGTFSFRFVSFYFKVLLRKVPTISELWKRLCGKKDKLFPEDFQESMCKLGLNLSKMEVCNVFLLANS